MNARDRNEVRGGVVLGVVLLLVALAVVLVSRANSDSDDSASLTGGQQTVQVTLADMRITPSKITVPAGTHLILEVTNTDSIVHDLYIDGGPETPLLSKGQHARLDLGTVTRSLAGWCTVPGHKAAGMTMSVDVTGGADGSGNSGMADMPSTSTPAGDSPTINFAADPGPDWKPYDPTLKPAPGATEHKITMRVADKKLEVAPGVRQTMWTYNGTVPGPILHGHVGDVFTVTLVNDTTMGHSIDFHAGSGVAPDTAMRTIEPGQSLVYQFKAEHSGAWLYHCSTMPMSLHIANGMFGAVIIDPPDLSKADQSFVLIQSELYLGAQDGVADSTKIQAEKPDAVVFNGYADQYDHAPIQVGVGKRIRVWIVDAGPQFGTSFHVVGAQFDTVFKEGAYLLKPGNAEDGAAQTLDLAPAQGGFVEFTLTQAGHYPFIDHAMVDAERGAHGVFEAK